MTAQRQHLLTKPAPDWARLVAFLLLFAVPSLVELILADRKFGIFTGGFGASRVVSGGAEIAAFALLFASCQLFVATLAWGTATWLHRRAWRTWLCVFGIGNVATGIALVMVAARYEIARYFSDALSFALVKQLGGGSIVDATLFVLDGNVVLPVVIIAGVAMLGWVVYRLARHVDTGNEQPWWPTRKMFAILGLEVALVVTSFYVADRTHGLRFVANRMISVAALRSVLAAATDFDGDGYGAFSLLRDRDPFDATRYPMALDRPGNGVDEDGIGGDWTLDGPPRPPASFHFPAKRPNVILIVIESMRGDALGRRINGYPVAPNLEALARTGFSTPAYSHVGFTTSSLKSIFTGEIVPKDSRHALFPLFRKAGYRIGIISGQPESFGDISGVTGMRANADVFVDANTLRSQRAFAFAAEGALLVDESRLLHAFDQRFGTPADWQKPVFLYMNFQSPHFPYWHDGMGKLLDSHPLDRAEIVPEAHDQLLQTYMNAVAWSDYHVGLLIERLRRLGVLDNSIVLVSGDHGEELFDDGFLGHGHKISPIQNRTSLVGNRPLAIDADAVSLSDYSRILAALIAGERHITLRGPALMHIGDIDTPVRIGTVSRGQWSIYDITNDQWSDGHRTIASQNLSPADRARRDAVISLWSRVRWESHAHD